MDTKLFDNFTKVQVYKNVLRSIPLCNIRIVPHVII